MKTRTLTLCALMLGSLFAGTWRIAAPKPQATDSAPAPAEPAGNLQYSAASVTLEVQGVSCAGCSISIRHALKHLGGVHEVRNGQSKQQIVVDYDPGVVTEGQIVQAIERTGYEAHVRA